MKKQMIERCLAILCSLQVAEAMAAGFALSEQSGSGLGNAFAGAAAVAEDASTIYFNPAGMTYIEGTQVVGAIHSIKPTGHFNDNGTTNATGSLPKNGEGGDLGDWAFLPNLYYKRDLSEAVKFGLGVNSPFGLKTEYDDNWMGRFQAIKSELKTININPSLAFKVNEQLSLGVGISAMWAEAELTRAVNPVFIPESTVKIKGSDWGFGFNLGAIYQLTADTRIGLAYRSKIEQQLKGDATFGAALSANNGHVIADMTLPETLSLSAFSRVNTQWELLADATWTRWSQFDTLSVYRTSGALLTSTPENWSNTMRYSVGANYRYSDTLKLRTGIAYDNEAISNQYRTARIPGNDRIWLSLGFAWKFSPQSTLDIGYAHLFVKDASINKDASLDDAPPTSNTNARLIGAYQGHVDILTAQVTHNF